MNRISVYKTTTYPSVLGNFSLISKHIKKVVDVRKFYECVPKVIFRSERKIKKVFTSIFKTTSVQLVFEKIL